jgi:hypothetical protein
MDEEVKGNEEDFSDGIGGAVIRAFYSPIRQPANDLKHLCVFLEIFRKISYINRIGGAVIRAFYSPIRQPANDLKHSCVQREYFANSLH